MRSETVLASAFVEEHPTEAARILESLAVAEAVAVLAAVAPRPAAEVVGRMTRAIGADCLARLPLDHAQAVVAALPRAAAVSLLRRADEGLRAALVGALDAGEVRIIESLLRYPEDSAGALADPHLLALPEALSAAEALARIRRGPGRVLSYVYVVDDGHRLAGVLSLHELLQAPPRAVLGALMRRDVVRLAASTPRAAIIAHPGHRRFHALPVVDDAGVFVGALRYATLRQLEQEADGGGQGRDTLATVLTLTELCWMGLTGVVVDLAAALAPAGTEIRGRD